MMEFEREMMRVRRERLLREAHEHRLAVQARRAARRAARTGAPATIGTVRDRRRPTARWSWTGLWARTARRA